MLPGNSIGEPSLDRVESRIGCLQNQEPSNIEQDLTRKIKHHRLYTPTIHLHQAIPMNQNDPNPSKRHILNIICGIETDIFPAYQLFKAFLVFNDQTLFVGQVQ